MSFKQLLLTGIPTSSGEGHRIEQRDNQLAGFFGASVALSSWPFGGLLAS